MASKEEQPVEKEPVKEKGKLKLILFICAALILSAGGVAAFFMISGGHGKDAKASTESRGAPVIYSMDPFIVNIYDGQELRYLRLKVEMEVADEDAKTDLAGRQAQVRDTILVLLSAKTLLDVRDQQGKNQLRQEIFSAVGRLFQADKIRKVYFTDFVVQ